MGESNYETPLVGRIFNVVAWWLKGEIVPCSILSTPNSWQSLDVRPLSGNTHARTVKIADLRGRIGGHPAETTG
jgi:hypothetical protein